MNTEKDNYEELQQDSATGPMKSVEGYVICITGLNGEVSHYFFSFFLQTTEDDIHDTFGAYGQIKNLHMNLDRRTGYVKGYAFLEFEELKTAKKAIDALRHR